MGQKKVIKKSEEEILKEEKKMETATSKTADVSVKAAKKKIDLGRVYINAGYNNTILTAADKDGNVLVWTSAGSIGFSGPKKATPFAASKMVAAAAEKMKKLGFSDIEIIIKGISKARDASIKALAGVGFNILTIKDVTPIPHNGPKPPKARRV